MFDNSLLLLNVLRLFEQQAASGEVLAVTRLVPNKDEQHQ